MKFNHTAYCSVCLVAVIDDDLGRPVQMFSVAIPAVAYIPARLYHWSRSLPWRVREYLEGWRDDLALTGQAIASGGEYWQILLS